jgi:hypothetical protein
MSFVQNHDTFSVKGRFELDRGPQYLGYGMWWHLGHDTAISSEWGTTNMVENGLNREILLAGGYGHQLRRNEARRLTRRCRSESLSLWDWSPSVWRSWPAAPCPKPVAAHP